LLALQNRRDKLNSLRLTTLRYAGDGTDFTLTLPPEHVWCTAQLTLHSGVAFVANLPTEEVFTTPHKDSAAGTVRVARPINYGGAMIDGIELEFRQGRVVRASARSGHDLLNRLLDTDDGAVRLGEVALVPHATTLASSGRLFHHSLLDENASDHIALGEAYDFCLRSPNPRATNRSLIHVDLSLDALVSSPGTDLS
jgi:aminopeptidase